MLRLGYFCSNNPSTSETFIYDLLKALSENEGFDVTFISGSSKPLQIDFEIASFSTGFNDKYSKTSYRLHKILSLNGNNAEYGRMRFNQWKAYKQLINAGLPVFKSISSKNSMIDNLYEAYLGLLSQNIVIKDEIITLEAWLKDFKKLNSSL